MGPVNERNGESSSPISSTSSDQKGKNSSSGTDDPHSGRKTNA